jgi:RNA polymerase sigma factor (sigma-70 family)
MATKLQPQFEGRGDLELLHLMAAGDSLAFDAWAEFYTRHGGYLYAVCKSSFEGRVGGHRIEDIVQDALVKAFHKAATVKEDATLDMDGQRRLVRAWLGTICKRIVSDYFRGQPAVDFLDDDALEAHEAADTWTGDTIEVDPVHAARLRMIEDGLETLTEREREVLRTTMTWSDLGSRRKVPHKAMAELTTDLNTNSGNVRKIRERGMAKFMAYVQSHRENTKE